MSITGPNAFPIAFVPNCCTENNRTMIPTTTGSTGKSGLMLLIPSTAEEIEMAGVINPSARRVAQPINAGIITHLIRFAFNSAKSAKIPPSPLLSAFNAK